MKYISLLTDFGLRDGYDGVMKGVIYRIAPEVQITDISHTIRPQNVREASLIWSRSYPYFPEGTVHVAVVDPGVGTHRRPLAAKIGQHFFVCPDNGLITPILEAAEAAGETTEIVHLNQPRFWLPQVSNVFHGRGIFAPSAAHISNGTPLTQMGSPISDPVRIHQPEPQKQNNGWKGEVITVDNFGNLGTNLSQEALKGMKNILVRIGDVEIQGLVKTFGERKPGDLVALIDSDDFLAISVVNGNAARTLHLDLGAPLEVIEKA